MSDPDQTKIDPFREMNRYDGRDEEWPSKAVYESPKRTLGNGWKKFHAARDCGARRLRYVEMTRYRPTSERYEYDIYCPNCGYKIPEDEILFIGGQWWNDHGWKAYGKMLEDLWLPTDRILDLGPDPSPDELKTALNLTRIENEAGHIFGFGFSDSDFSECDTCGQKALLLFDGKCRPCYDGEWTRRMQGSVDALGIKVREANRSFVHRLEDNVDPLHPADIAGHHEILWRRHAQEATSKLVEVTQRFKDHDDGHMEYILTDPSNTEYWRYHEDDLADCFWSTGLYNDEPKAVMDERIRELYERVK